MKLDGKESENAAVYIVTHCVIERLRALAPQENQFGPFTVEVCAEKISLPPVSLSDGLERERERELLG